jgi:excisionase family DNA binding protein
MNNTAHGSVPVPSSDPRSWWTPKQIAETLQVTTRTVARWIASGALPAHRFGRSVRIADADFKEFISNSRPV